VLRWNGGALSELSVPIKRKPLAICPSRTPSSWSGAAGRALPRRDHRRHPQPATRRTARGLPFTASRVRSLRHHWHIDAHQPSDDAQECRLLTIADAAAELATAPSTLHRWLNDGFIPGEQDTPGRGALGSPTNCAPRSSTTPPTAGSSCKTPPKRSTSAAKPYCSESSAATCKPSTSAPDAEKAYE
jgi:hypothetical protein